MGNSPKSKKFEKRDNEVNEPDIPLIDWKAPRRRTSLRLIQLNDVPDKGDHVREDVSRKRVATAERAVGHVKRSKADICKASQPDSDFVDESPQPRMTDTKNIRDVKGKQKLDDADNALVIGAESDGDDDLFPSLNTRSSSSMFVKAVSGLTDAQKHSVREMGLGRLMDLTITTIPLKMGFWLVDNFNHMDRKLRLHDGEKVHVKEEDVHSTFGLPRGDIEISNKKKRAGSELLDQWVSLFDVRIPSNITASKVLYKIRECKDGDDWFKRHFIVLMVTCLFESSSNGMANFRLVHMLDNLTNVCNMNWCSYMIRCLVDTKRTWDAIGKQKKYTGPLLFLTLFYVDRVVLSMRTVARSVPTFVSWSNELLKIREQAEIASGAFGRGFIDDDLHVAVDGRRLDGVGVATANDDARSAMEPTVLAYVQNFASKTRLLATIGDEILQLVEKAPQVLVGDENFLKMQDAAQKLMGVYTDVSKGDTNQPNEGHRNETAPAHDIAKDNDRDFTYPTFDDAFWSDPETLAALDEIVKAVERRKRLNERFKRMQDDVPSFSLGLTPDDGDANQNYRHTGVADPTPACDKTPQSHGKSPELFTRADHGDDVHGSPRPKRQTKASSFIKSPFKERVLNVIKKLDGKERMISNWILKNDTHDDSVIIYRSSDYQSLDYSVRWPVVACLIPNMPITNELLDLWSTILNFNENFKSRGAPACFFATTSPCNELFFESKRKRESDYRKFAETLDSEIRRRSSHDLKKIAMILFPVHSGTFSGVICASLETQKLYVLYSDGKCKDGVVTKPVMSLVKLLQRSVSKFLNENSLVKSSKSIALTIPEVIDTAWTEGVDEVDIGVMTMRHMETFKGGSTKSWKPKLKMADKGQIKLIRKRYSYFIACCPNNDLKDINLTAAMSFHPLYLAKKRAK